MKEKCWCGKPVNHSAKKIAKGMARIMQIMRDSVVEYDKPKENGEIGTIMGIPIFISPNSKDKNE